MADRIERGLNELYNEDPERADALVFGRVTDASRRGFLRGAGLGAMTAALGVVAIPHARSNSLHGRGAFLRLGRPVDFGARDGTPVDLVFAMTASDDRPELHLEHLAGVAERLADAEFRERLREARNVVQLRSLLLPAPATHRAA